MSSDELKVTFEESATVFDMPVRWYINSNKVAERRTIRIKDTELRSAVVLLIKLIHGQLSWLELVEHLEKLAE